ncbi:MAG: Flp family type IVb pilin [Gemmataceae bacterium]
MLRSVTNTVVRFLKAEEGPTAVEYAVMLAFIISVCFVAISNIGSQTKSSFQNPALQSSMTTAASS